MRVKQLDHSCAQCKQVKFTHLCYHEKKSVLLCCETGRRWGIRHVVTLTRVGRQYEGRICWCSTKSSVSKTSSQFSPKEHQQHSLWPNYFPNVVLLSCCFFHVVVLPEPASQKLLVCGNLWKVLPLNVDLQELIHRLCGVLGFWRIITRIQMCGHSWVTYYICICTCVCNIHTQTNITFTVLHLHPRRFLIKHCINKYSHANNC